MMKRNFYFIRISSLLTFLLLRSTISGADNLNIAVASNFAHTLHSLASDFESRTGHQLRISSASTGKLYTQIKHGAPFDVFLAADEHRPDLLISEGKATIEFSRTYAVGKLVLVSNLQQKTNCQDVLDDPALKRLAIANPQIAPYGFAAQQTLEKLQRWKFIQSKLVMGENIAQTLQFVSTGNANAGFVAQSMLLQGTKINVACEWKIPSDMHEPIKQKMLVLLKAINKPAAISFWQYMQTIDAKEIIKHSGYDTP